MLNGVNYWNITVIGVTQTFGMESLQNNVMAIGNKIYFNFYHSVLTIYRNCVLFFFLLPFFKASFTLVFNASTKTNEFKRMKRICDVYTRV